MKKCNEGNHGILIKKEVKEMCFTDHAGTVILPKERYVCQDCGKEFIEAKYFVNVCDKPLKIT